MFNNVLDYYDSINISYNSDSSIYLDACFLLINFNDGQEDIKEKVANLIEKWRSEGVETLRISNHVSTEVINVLFILNIKKVIEIVYLKITGQIESYEEEHLEQIIDPRVAKDLYNFGLDQKIKNWLWNNVPQKEDINIKVSDVLKNAKRILTPANRKKFDIYYQKAVNEYELLTKAFLYRGFNVVPCISENNDLEKSKEYMGRFLLESYDAIHLAIAKHNECDYFATLDGDFSDVNFQEEDGKPITVLKLRDETGMAAYGF